MARTIKKKILPVVVIIVGVVVFMGLNEMRTKPQRAESKPFVPLVEVITAQAGDERLQVYGTGTVKASTGISIVPQVTGKIVRLSPNMVDGGFFGKDEELFRIESSDYELQVETALAELARQEVQLRIEEEEARIARAEWADYQRVNPALEPGALTLREPQLKLAQANLAAAQARLKLARLNLKRTVITAPFAGRVVKRNVDVGQVVGQGASLAVVYSTERVEIVVPVPSEEAAWLEIPRSDESGERPSALVRARYGGRSYEWQGTLVRDEAGLDPRSRMLNLIVAIENAYERRDGKPPLMENMFVDVEIAGRVARNVYRLPRHLIRDEGTVWLAVDGKLELRPVRVLRFVADEAIVEEGLNPGDRIVATSLSPALPGMEIRVSAGEERAS